MTKKQSQPNQTKLKGKSNHESFGSEAMFAWTWHNPLRLFSVTLLFIAWYQKNQTDID